MSATTLCYLPAGIKEGAAMYSSTGFYLCPGFEGTAMALSKGNIGSFNQ